MSALNRNDKIAVAVILILFAALATLYSIVTPVFEGFDENWHYAVVQYIASGRGLPRQPAEQFPHLAQQEASQPPLYYALAAVATFWVPKNDTKIYERYNPQFVPIPWDYRDNKNIIVHTDAENFPWQGTVLAIHLARFISVLLGTLTIYFTYLLARSLFPDDRMLAIGAMLLAALTPSFIFTSALVNNDVLIAFLSSASLVLLVRLVQVMQNTSPAHRGQFVRLAAILALFCALAVLTKLSGLGLYLLIGIALPLVAWRTKDFRGLFICFLLLAFSFSLVAGWWYVRNWMLYGDVTGLNAMLDIMGRREPRFGFADLLPEFEGVRWSYWALFGQTNLVVNESLYHVWDLITVIALVGLAIFFVRAIRSRNWKNVFAAAFLAAWFIIVLVGLVRWALTTPGSQGRLLYPAISAISILLVRGWLEFFPRQSGKFIAIAGAVLFVIALYVPFFVIVPAYAQPELLRQDQVANFISTRTNVRFGQVSLLGYRVEQQTVKPGELLWVTACWSSDEKITEDYFVFAQLLVENDLIAAQKDTYHGLGAFPTSQWQPRTIFCDRYPLRVRDTVPPSPSNVSIGLYRASGERLPARSDEKLIGDNIRFAGPAIVAATGHARFDYNWAKQIALIDYGLDKTAAHPGDHLTVSLSWKAPAPLGINYVATIQIMDANGKIIGQSDMPLRIPIDERVISISPYAEPGIYEIKVGVYQSSPVENLPLYHDGRRMQGSDLLSLWWLRVLP